MEKLVEVSDQEVRIDFILGTKCRANVRLRSLCASSPVSFKVQTSSPDKFLVNPPSGLIQPLSYAVFQVILKPQSQLPSSFPRSPSDRFLIKTSLQSHPSISHDVKLRVAYVGPYLLKQAVSNGNFDAVKSLVKREKTVISNLSSKEADSLLRLATESGKDVLVNLLLESGLRGEKDDVGWTELHVAADNGRTEEVARMVRDGRDLDVRDKEGRTPLHLAASKGHARCVRKLVEGGADKNARSIDGKTSLYRAAANGDRRIVELLIELGADPSIATIDRGRCPLDIAREKGHNEVVEILERGEAVLTSARRGELNLLGSLLVKGATVNHHDQYGLTPIHAAAIKGHTEVVVMLVNYGADLECQDLEGHRPLHLAVEGGDLETVEVLINLGSNVNAMTKRGATPLSFARALGYDDISQLLLDRGASCSLRVIVGYSSKYQ
ncbi:Ankyrin repeat [Dillenia turbinata]|uniref:Ankyrin repeat n=1 Tax=Dillenia turbinata TaxID=194707 RepID=A0AAN8VT80_9MAGN